MGDGDAAARPDEAEVGRIFREESGRSLAALIRVFGEIDLAEDAVQEAFAVALGKWPHDGMPPNPGGWITTTARHHAIDRLRRESRGRQLLGDVAVLTSGSDGPGVAQEGGPVADDRLRLIFTCCHPALSTHAQMALTLRLLGGLSTGQVARSFLVSEATMAARLVRAKHKITAAKIPYRVPEAQELPGRLGPVLAVVYLVYTAGLSSSAEPGLCAEGIRLARILVALMPEEPEVAGLLALLLLTESRRGSRTRPDGSLVLLGEQDRTRWDRALIAEGQAILRRCPGRQQPGAYQLQAAINAVHADAPTVEQTDWPQIIALCDQLLGVAPPHRSWPSTGPSPSARSKARPPRWPWWTSWPWTTTTPSTPPAPICSGGWADTARPRPPTSAPLPWRRPAPSKRSSGSVAEPHAERPGDLKASGRRTSLKQSASGPTTAQPGPPATRLGSAPSPCATPRRRRTAAPKILPPGEPWPGSPRRSRSSPPAQEDQVLDRAERPPSPASPDPSHAAGFDDRSGTRRMWPSMPTSLGKP
jgi:RNA polymerase sigma-70 factor, ECF subfamily